MNQNFEHCKVVWRHIFKDYILYFNVRTKNNQVRNKKQLANIYLCIKSSVCFFTKTKFMKSVKALFI